MKYTYKEEKDRGRNKGQDKGDLIITNTTKGNPPIGGLPFSAMKDAVLGKTYDLSLVFVSRQMIRKLNREHRGKDSATDILSFPLDTKTGEVFVNVEETKKEAKKFDRKFENFLGFLFIHGLVHLKGFDHGSRMEEQERKIRREFGI